ncbi:MAG: hypothetical protein ACXWCY_05845 [Burkholderiales bacterium]
MPREDAVPVKFSRAILQISPRNSTGILGRHGRHFHRHNRRHHRTLPSDHRLRLYYEQRSPPFEEPCQDNQAGSGCGVYPPGLDTALFEQSQLPPKKQILRLDRLGRSKSKNYEPGSICEKLNSDLDERDHLPIMT